MKLSDYDEIIIRYADTLSAEAISFKLKGELTPAQVKKRLDELLTVPDALTAIQQDQLVTQKMRALVARMEELPLTARNAEVLLKGLVEIGNRLDRREAVNERDLNKFYGFEGQVLFEAVVATLAHMRGMMVGAEKIAEEEWDHALERSLRFAQVEINKHSAEPDAELLALAEAGAEADPETVPSTRIESASRTTRATRTDG